MSTSSDRSLTPGDIAIIKATVPALEAHGLDITTEMYRRLLADPTIAEMFDPAHQKNGAQPRALAMAVLAYAKNIDNLGVMGSAVERIAQKHVSLEIQPEHYPHVATALLGAIKSVLGDAATPDILNAWGKAYWALADILIGREHQLYDASAHAEGGWTGWRPFIIDRTERNCETATSVYLRPADNKPVIAPKPGQYLGVDLEIPGHGRTRRNYSITSSGHRHGYRITARHIPNGAVSTWLNSDQCPGTPVLLSPPAGDFTLPEKLNGPIAFVAAGIGITPFIPMLDVLSRPENTTPVQIVQVAHSSATAPFARELAEVARNSDGRIRLTTRLTEKDGHPDAVWVAQQIPAEATVYICGPLGFMRDIVNGLPKAGIATNRLRYETFGPDTGVTD
ncbi:globin domain-containing protein [Gluconobacter morbifer]|uniref:nitric oxide dioxygenase n=1 Tax=Gluconobacter morbifer G707 TaxID=1088869 RepID=G6XK11_9PROT|nr:globin domain-containing protein [Gluconobacter morbifer]EHH67973.1 flavohemoprotein [Gluconobacter morbifer G707]